MFKFAVIEAGLRLPKGVTQGNLLDLGNYQQCLGINKKIEHMTIKGKYCRISVGLNEDLINSINVSKTNMLNEEMSMKLKMLKTHMFRSTNDLVMSKLDDVEVLR